MTVYKEVTNIFSEPLSLEKHGCGVNARYSITGKINMLAGDHLTEMPVKIPISKEIYESIDEQITKNRHLQIKAACKLEVIVEGITFN